MDLIQQKAHCFFTENMWAFLSGILLAFYRVVWFTVVRGVCERECLPFRSEDDPFLLYATLSSGNHCWFISKDLMRDHKACLSDNATRRLFFKWQRGHQVVVDGSISTARQTRFLVRSVGSRGRSVIIYIAYRLIMPGRCFPERSQLWHHYPELRGHLAYSLRWNTGPVYSRSPAAMALSDQQTENLCTLITREPLIKPFPHM